MDESKPELKQIYRPTSSRKAQAALFMSGSGTNGLRVLEHEQSLGEDSPFYVSVIVTDNPRSNAGEIADKYGRPFIQSDIKAFYLSRDLKKVSLKTDKGRQVREEWTGRLRGQLEEYAVDIGIFGGFVPLTNITAGFPCVNIHPGDLTYKKDGKRYLVGLHTEPIKRAMLEGLDTVRSSAIIATPYDLDGSDMDTGPLLAVGPEVAIPQLPPWMLEELKENPGDYEPFLKTIQNRLKINSDWKTLPLAVQWVAEGKYALDADNNVYFEGDMMQNGVQITALDRQKGEFEVK